MTGHVNTGPLSAERRTFTKAILALREAREGMDGYGAWEEADALHAEIDRFEARALELFKSAELPVPTDAAADAAGIPDPDPADDLPPSGGQAEEQDSRAYPIQVFQSNVDRYRPWEVRSILPGGGFRVLDRWSTHARAAFSADRHRAAVEAMIVADDAMLRNAR